MLRVALEQLILWNASPTDHLIKEETKPFRHLEEVALLWAFMLMWD